MRKQDRQGVRTARDLERKYTFGSIKKTEIKTDEQGKTLTGAEFQIKENTENLIKVIAKTAVAQTTADKAKEDASMAQRKAEDALTGIKETQAVAKKTKTDLVETQREVEDLQTRVDATQDEVAIILENNEINAGKYEAITNEELLEICKM